MRLAELSLNESADRTTETARFLLRFGLGEHPDDRLRARRAHEHAAAPVELRVSRATSSSDARGSSLLADLDVLLRLRDSGA